MPAGNVEIGSRDAARELGRLAIDLRRAGAGTIEKEMYKALARVARDEMKPAVVKSAGETLPSTGGKGRRGRRMVKTGVLTNKVSGRRHVVRTAKFTSKYKRESLAARVMNANYSIKTVAGRNPTVRFTAKDSQGRSVDLRKLDGGIVRHPTFGHSPWEDQAVNPGWFTDPLEKLGPEVKSALEGVVDTIEKIISGK
jgi:hypothetical protein